MPSPSATSAVVAFGRWPSPLAASQVAQGRVSLYELMSDGATLYWTESRPSEAGRVVLVRWRDGTSSDHSPPGSSLRSRVHEYGVGAVCLVAGHADGAFAYVELTDQRVWFCAGLGAPPRPLTTPAPEGETWHHGGVQASTDGDWVLAIREIHRADDPHGVPSRMIIALSTRSDVAPASVLTSEHDFYGTPAIHPEGDRIAVVAWDHPDMEWDASRLLVVPLSRQAGTAPTLRPSAAPHQVAGGPNESVGQPAWRPDGTLRFVSDRAGWWQPYVHSGAPDGSESTALSSTESEFHGPDWGLSQSTMADLAGGQLVAARTGHGLTSLVVLAPAAASPTQPDTERVIAQPCVAMQAVCAAGPSSVAIVGTTPEASSTIWLVPDITMAAASTDDSANPVRALRPVPDLGLRPGDAAPAEPFDLVSPDGRRVYGVLFRPALTDTHGPTTERPPLVVTVHGGPTGSSVPGFDLIRQYFTTRGFAVAAVDYAGSSGYGRAFRNSLWGQWGVFDSEDCLEAARFLATRGDVDPTRMAIRGNSSGGLTALNACLLTGPAPTFAAAVTWFGVTDLLTLAASTHDFEARYMDRLIGPLPVAEALYRQRSPVYRAHELTTPVLMLQGTDDRIVPPSQALQMRDAMEAAGGQCELHFYEGEGHGFRRADTITAALEAELAFYWRHLRL